MNATDRPFRLKIRLVYRVLVLSDRATCAIVSRVNFFDTNLSEGGVCLYVLCSHFHITKTKLDSKVFFVTPAFMKVPRTITFLSLVGVFIVLTEFRY